MFIRDFAWMMAWALAGALVLALGVMLLPEPLNEEALNSRAGFGGIVLIALGGVAAFFFLAGALTMAGGMAFVRGFCGLLALGWIWMIGSDVIKGELFFPASGRRSYVRSRTIYWDQDPVLFALGVLLTTALGLLLVWGIYVVLRKWHEAQSSRQIAGDSGPRRKTALASFTSPRAAMTAEEAHTLLRQAQAGDSSAVQLLMFAARQGDVSAQMELGAFHHLGQGTSKDDAQAAQWFRMAAEQGNPYAQYNTGRMAAEGHGVTQDHAEAARWYRKAAAQGFSGAQYDLGMLYANGQGVAQNKVAACALLHLAATAPPPGNSDAARQALGTLTMDMTSQQIDAARTLAGKMERAAGMLAALDAWLVQPHREDGK
jgi:hypothetical protein